MSLHRLTLEEFQNLIPAVQEQWHRENYAVFLALCIKDQSRAGMKRGMILVTVVIVIRQWLTDYLKINHAAVASPDDYKHLVLSFMGEAMDLSEVLP